MWVRGRVRRFTCRVIKLTYIVLTVNSVEVQPRYSCLSCISRVAAVSVYLIFNEGWTGTERLFLCTASHDWLIFEIV